MNRNSYPSLVLALSLLAASYAANGSQEGVSGDPPPPTEGGVRANRVESVTINNYGTRRQDPRTQAMASRMISLSNRTYARTEPLRQGFVYTVLYDSDDPFFRPSRQTYKSYEFYVGPPDPVESISPNHSNKCVVQYEYHLIGFVATTTFAQEISIDVDEVSVDDPLLQSLCESLDSDASAAWGSPSNDSGRDGFFVSNYDLLTRGREATIVIRIAPGETIEGSFEERLFNHYWLTAFSSIDYLTEDMGLSQLLESQLGRRGVIGIQRQIEENASFSVSFNTQRFSSEHSPASLSEAATRYFGETYTNMDRAWRELIEGGLQSTAQLRSDRFPVRPLLRFRLNDIGTGQFWAHISDAGDLIQFAHCAAAMFAVEREYAAASELDIYANCVSQP